MQLRHDLPKLNNLQIPRRVRLSNKQNLHLHHFTDASEKARTAASYAGSSWGEKICSNFLIVKTRVAPVKIVCQLATTGTLWIKSRDQAPQCGARSSSIHQMERTRGHWVDRFKDCAAVVESTSESLDNLRGKQMFRNSSKASMSEVDTCTFPRQSPGSGFARN